MERHIFNLKFAAKEMARNARKCEKQHKLEKDKCKKAIRQGNIDVAKIHAENAIRHKTEQTTFLTMSARLDTIASRIEYATTMRKVSNSMVGVTKAMDVALKSMNLERISRLMDKFEEECVQLDLQAATIDNAMQDTVTTMAPQNQVDNFLIQVAEEAGLDVSLEMPSARSTLLPSLQESTNREELEKRLTTLRKEG